jgi:subtilisin family serine protease
MIASAKTQPRRSRLFPDMHKPKPLSFSGSAPPLNDRFLGEDENITGIGLLENQWYIFRCNADKAWSLATGKGVTITVIDEGFDAEHEDLKPNIDMVFNSTTKNSQISTRSSGSAKHINHGTACAGLAAAVGNNNVGIAGFAFNAKLRLAQAFKDASSADPAVPETNIRAAIGWAGLQPTSGRHVITISLGVGDTYDQIPIDAAPGSATEPETIRMAIDAAIDNNIVVCISAGNSSNTLGQDLSTDQKGILYTSSNAIVVGATRKNQQGQDVPSNSNWGPRMTVCAPGDPAHDMTCSSKPDPYTNKFGGAEGSRHRGADA